MKAILKFFLPDEEVDFTLAANARTYAAALWDIERLCRNIVKYDEQRPSVREFAEAVRDMIPELPLD